jgi:hypothetical protein
VVHKPLLQQDRQFGVCLLLSLLFVASLVGTAHAEIGFRDPQTLSEPGIDSAEQQVSVDSQDRAIAVWQASLSRKK